MQDYYQARPVLHNLPAKPMKTNSTSDKVHCVYSPLFREGDPVYFDYCSLRPDLFGSDAYHGDAGDENDAIVATPDSYSDAVTLCHTDDPVLMAAFRTPIDPHAPHSMPQSNHTPIEGNAE